MTNKHYRGFLADKGLSLSQAQAVSNLANQRAEAINRVLNKANNYTTVMKVDGEFIKAIEKRALDATVVKVKEQAASYTEVIAFLREVTKAKEAWYEEVKKSQYITTLLQPQYPQMVMPTPLSKVEEEWGWMQLSQAEILEYVTLEARASEIGKFIHEDGHLTKLRKELPTLPPFFKESGWNATSGYIANHVHIHEEHKNGKLDAYHEEFASKHREYNQRVNYFKAKVKNLVNDENARIAGENAKAAQTYAEEYRKIQKDWNDANNEYGIKYRAEFDAFEKSKAEKLKEIQQYRIHIPQVGGVDTTVQVTINLLLAVLKPEEKKD